METTAEVVEILQPLSFLNSIGHGVRHENLPRKVFESSALCCRTSQMQGGALRLVIATPQHPQIGVKRCHMKDDAQKLIVFKP